MKELIKIKCRNNTCCNGVITIFHDFPLYDKVECDRCNGTGWIHVDKSYIMENIMLINEEKAEAIKDFDEELKEFTGYLQQFKN